MVRPGRTAESLAWSCRMLSQTDPRRHRRLAAMLLLLSLAILRGSRVGSGQVETDALRWKVGQPIAVEVKQGRFSAVLPSPNPNARCAVIVSTLGGGSGPYRVQLRATEADSGSIAWSAAATEPMRRKPQAAKPRLAQVAPVSRTLPARERSFHLMARDGDVSSASNYDEVPAVLLAIGQRVQVYADKADAKRVGPDVVADILATFDRKVFPHAAARIGQARDIDQDGRFTVLLTSRLTRLAGGRHAVDGFVRSADLDRGLPAPFSNHCDMMYLSTSLKAGPHLRTVLAHEYTHAVVFCAKTQPGGSAISAVAEEEGWLDEAIAHLVEDEHGFSRSNIDYRVSAFLSQPERYRLVVDDYYAADLFRSHGNRGGTYLFLRWCVDRFGPGLIPALVASRERGRANLEAATGVSFAELYRSWSVALLLSGLDPRITSYEPFRTLDLRAALDGWPLAGPRTVAVKPGAEPVSWDSAATASRFVVVEASRTGAVRLEIEAAAAAELQVTLVPLPEELPRLEISAELTASPSAGVTLRTRVRESAGRRVRIERLCWEPLVPGPDPQSTAFRRKALDVGSLARALGTTTVPPFGDLASAPIPAGESLPPGTPLVLKAVGVDDQGRRVSAWAEVAVADARLGRVVDSKKPTVTR
ncbi:MAG: hypothetical protein U0794_14470 [Isosphaeraceae bacterium]